MAPPPKKQTVPPKKKPPLQSNGNVQSVKKKAPANAKKPPAKTNSKGAAVTTTKKKPELVSPTKKPISARDIEAQKTKPVPQPRKKKAFTKEEERDDDGKKPLLAVLLICCCCIIIALVLGLVFGLKDNGDDGDVASSGTGPTMPNVGNSPSLPQPTALNPSSPQSSPSGSEPSFNLPATPAPTNLAGNSSPVASPVSNPVTFPVSNPAPTDPNPADFVLLPNADTSIQNGLNTNVINGGADVLYIQNGELNTQDNFDSYVLLNFDPSEIPNQNYKKARLRLHHVPFTNNIERPASTITVIRLPETRLAIETLDGNIFQPSGGEAGPSFTFNLMDTVVEVDISSLVFPVTGNDLFLQLENRGAIQVRGTGDEFRSREYQQGLFAPELLLDL
jgi:hypothetical protein